MAGILKQGLGITDPRTARVVYELERRLSEALKRIKELEDRCTAGGI